MWLGTLQQALSLKQQLIDICYCWGAEYYPFFRSPLGKEAGLWRKTELRTAASA